MKLFCTVLCMFALHVSADPKVLLDLVSKANLPELQKAIKDGASANVKLDNGKTLLVFAVEQGNIEIVKELLESGKADPNVPAPSGLYPLHIAAKDGNAGIIHELIHHKADVEAVAKGAGMRAIHYIVEKSGEAYESALAELINEGKADVNAWADVTTPVTPLMIAATNGQSTHIDFLVHHGAKLDILDKNKLTALHYAATHGRNVSSLIPLLEAGANIELKDHTGQTAKDLALKNVNLKDHMHVFEDHRAQEHGGEHGQEHGGEHQEHGEHPEEGGEHHDDGGDQEENQSPHVNPLLEGMHDEL